MSADPNPTPDIVTVDPVPNPDEPSPHIPAAAEPEIVVATGDTPAQVVESLAAQVGAMPQGEMVSLKNEVAYLSNPLADYDQESVKLIVDVQTKVDELLQDYEQKNTDAKEAKKKHEAAVEQLQELIRERVKNRGKPVQRTLFDLIPSVPPPVEGVKAGSNDDKLAELWREFPMERMTRFGMTETDIQKLADGRRKGGHDPFPIRTIGQLADYTANAHGTPGYENRLTDFHGIGLGGATRITDANESWWKWWNAGGQTEYATERGLISGPQAEPGAGATDPQQPGGEGDGGGPIDAGDGASIGPVEITVATEPEESFVVPEGAGDEYALGGEGEGAVHGAEEEGAVPEVPEPENDD